MSRLPAGRTVPQRRPSPAATLLAAGGQLPSGHHRFSREFVVRSQRTRMLDAMARAVAEKGYEKTSVADVVARAGVSRKTFYEQFADKEACFLAAYETIFAEFAAAALAAYESRRSWPDRIANGIAAFLGRLAEEPAYAKAGIVDVLAAGPNAIALRDRLLRGFYSFFDPSRPEVPDHGLPRIVAEGAIGGIYEVIYRRIAAQGSETLGVLLPDLTYLALVPFLGQRAALKAAGMQPSDGAFAWSRSAADRPSARATSARRVRS